MTATFPDLDGASVFISGGGSGIGAHLTEGFLRQGAKVCFVQRSDGTAFAEEMQTATGAKPLFVKCDVTDVNALKSAFAQASEAHGPVTRLVANAANDKRHLTEEVTEDFFDWSQSINFKSYFFSAQAAVPYMRQAGHGMIVNFSSISYMMGNAGYPIYAASNAGITGLTRSLAREFGPENIRVNTLAPGWVLTEKQMALWASDEDLAAHMGRMCLKEHLRPADIVEPTLFLASTASTAMTGQLMAVDGGVVATG